MKMYHNVLTQFPAVSHHPGLLGTEGFPRRRNSSAKTRTVLGKRGWWVTLPTVECLDCTKYLLI